jgi:hypothetical protein
VAEVVLDDSVGAVALIDSDWIRTISYDSADSDNDVLLFRLLSIVDSDKVFIDSDWIRTISYDSDDSDNDVLLFRLLSIVDSDKVFIDSDWIRTISYDSADSDNLVLLLKNLTINTVNPEISILSKELSSFSTPTVSTQQVPLGESTVKENWS